MKDPVNIENLTIEEDGPFFLIAGPCVIESEETTLEVAAFLKETSQIMDIPIIFKTSYDKANRTSVTSPIPFNPKLKVLALPCTTLIAK